MPELPQFVVDILDNIARAEGFVDFTYELNPGCKHGDSFLGVITSVLVSGQRKVNGTTVADGQLHLICKLEPADELRKREFQSNAVFKREILLYNKILPLLAEFQQEKGLAPADCFTSYPKCYTAIADDETDQFVVIMEDLRAQQFAMWPKDKPIQAGHAYLAIEKLAKLHAVSFALRDQRPAVFNSLINGVGDLFQVFFKSEGMLQMLNSAFDRAIKVLTNEKHVRVMETVKESALPSIIQFLAPEASGEYGVIGHGDVWTNNILFQHNNQVNEIAVSST